MSTDTMSPSSWKALLLALAIVAMPGTNVGAKRTSLASKRHQFQNHIHPRSLADAAFVPIFSASLDDGVDVQLPLRHVLLYGTSGDKLSADAYDVVQGAISQYLEDWWWRPAGSSSHLSTLSNVRSEIQTDEALIDFDNGYELVGNNLEVLITMTFREGGGSPTVEEGASGGPFQVDGDSGVEYSENTAFMPPEEDLNAAVTKALDSDFSSPSFLEQYLWSALEQVPEVVNLELSSVNLIAFHEVEGEVGQSGTVDVGDGDAAWATPPDANSPVISSAGAVDNVANEGPFSKPLNVALLALLILLLVVAMFMCCCFAKKKGCCEKRCGNNKDADTLDLEPEIDSESAQYRNEAEYEEDFPLDAASHERAPEDGDIDELADASPAERAAHAELDGYCMAARSNSFHEPNKEEQNGHDDEFEPEAGMAPEVLKLSFLLPQERRSWLSLQNRVKHKVVISE